MNIVTVRLREESDSHTLIRLRGIRVFVQTKTTQLRVCQSLHREMI